jgi:hypothetical protein
VQYFVGHSLGKAELGLVAYSFDENNAVQHGLSHSSPKFRVWKVEAQIDVLSKDSAEEGIALVDTRARLPPQKLSVNPRVHLQTKISILPFSFPLGVRHYRIKSLFESLRALLQLFAYTSLYST